MVSHTSPLGNMVVAERRDADGTFSYCAFSYDGWFGVRPYDPECKLPAFAGARIIIVTGCPMSRLIAPIEKSVTALEALRLKKPVLEKDLVMTVGEFNSWANKLVEAHAGPRLGLVDKLFK